MIKPIYPYTSEEIVKEYINAMKYHIDNNVLIKKDIAKIQKQVNDYLKTKGA